MSYLLYQPKKYRKEILSQISQLLYFFNINFESILSLTLSDLNELINNLVTLENEYGIVKSKISPIVRKNSSNKLNIFDPDLTTKLKNVGGKFERFHKKPTNYSSNK